MKIWKLANFYFAAIAKPLGLMCLLLGPTQFLVMAGLTWLRGRHYFSITPMETAFVLGLGVAVLVVCLLAAMALPFVRGAQQYGRTKSIYTLLTLPGSPAAIYWGQVLANIAAVYAVIASQLVWYAVLYAPYTWVEGSFNQALARTVSPIAGQLAEHTLQNGLFYAFSRNLFLRLIAPLSPLSIAAVACLIFGLCACFTSLAGKRGWRLAAGLLPLAISLLCLMVWCVLQALCMVLADGMPGEFIVFFYALPPLSVLLGLAAALLACRALKRRSVL